MFSVVLTKSTGVLGPIASLLGIILNAIFEFLQLFNIENVAIVIILFTFIVRGLMIPLNIKQQKFTKLQSVMNPEITKITEKYKGKKDEQSVRNQQLETQAVYQKYGASPTAGCLPMIIMLPIMFALYRVIYRIPAYVGDIYALYESIAVAIQSSPGYTDIIVPMASASVQTSKFAELANGSLTIDHIIDIMNSFKTAQWAELATAFPDSAALITENAAHITKINQFIGGLNILDNPGYKLPGILIPILSGLLQFFQSKQMSANNPQSDKENPMASTMKTMNIVMPITSIFFCIMLPIGVGIYWVAGSVFAIIQQFAVNKYMDKIDLDELIKKNLEKQSKRKAKLGIDPSKSMAEIAKQNTKNINNTTNKLETTKDRANVIKKNYESSSVDTNTQSYKPGSIAERANILKNKNNDKGDK